MLLAAWLSAFVLPSDPAIAADPTPAQNEAELKRVRSRIDRIQKEINADIRKRDSLGAELKDAEQSVQSARRRLEEAREQRIESESQLRELEPGLWCAQAFGGHGLATTSVGGEIIARAIHGDRAMLDDVAAFGLPSAHKPLGYLAAQATYSWLQYQDARRDRR